MNWLRRARKATAGQRVTRADKQRATDALTELGALDTDRERLMHIGLAGVATIVGIHPNVAITTLGSWHELELDVQLPERDSYRATRRIALELATAPHIAVGAELPVRVDPQDLSKVLVVPTL
ncbi:hypothetical protein [Mycobacterium attenuatum]|uniref:hypothetical protein n=1 Tax=Mycobacterium attenuatum TaxID=2341086 RepID=UPI000F01BA46|nr:hypothetical protein [Mycobacterium attenuatum]VBA58550.1 hypothetical protein LAUMK41_03027 [Mycobacterium attenuatum]